MKNLTFYYNLNKKGSTFKQENTLKITNALSIYRSLIRFSCFTWNDKKLVNGGRKIKWGKWIRLTCSFASIYSCHPFFYQFKSFSCVLDDHSREQARVECEWARSQSILMHIEHILMFSWGNLNPYLWMTIAKTTPLDDVEDFSFYSRAIT